MTQATLASNDALRERVAKLEGALDRSVAG